MELQPAVIYAITLCGSDAQLDQQRLCSKFSSLSSLDIMFWSKRLAVYQISMIIMCSLYTVLWTRKGEHAQRWTQAKEWRTPQWSHQTTAALKWEVGFWFHCHLNLCFALMCCFFLCKVKTSKPSVRSFRKSFNLYHSSPSFTVFPFLWFSHYLCLGKLPFDSWFLTPHRATLQTLIFHVLFSVLAVRLLGCKWWNFFKQLSDKISFCFIVAK